MAVSRAGQECFQANLRDRAMWRRWAGWRPLCDVELVSWRGRWQSRMVHRTNLILGLQDVNARRRSVLENVRPCIGTYEIGQVDTVQQMQLGLGLTLRL